MKEYNKEKSPPGKQHRTRLLKNVNDRLLRKERGIECVKRYITYGDVKLDVHICQGQSHERYRHWSYSRDVRRRAKNAGKAALL